MAVSNLYWHHVVNMMAIACNWKGHHYVEASLLPHSHTPGSQHVGLVEFPDIAHVAKIQRNGGKTLHRYPGCNLFGQVLTASVLALIWWFSWLFLMLKIFSRSVRPPLSIPKYFYIYLRHFNDFFDMETMQCLWIGNQFHSHLSNLYQLFPVGQLVRGNMHTGDEARMWKMTDIFNLFF